MRAEALYLIKRKDVIWLYVPFPDINSGLARKRHMYICQHEDGSSREFVKCQTLKPYMLINNPMKHFWDESPDIARNPFVRKTRIDCDQTFLTEGIRYRLSSMHLPRPDVCDDTMLNIESELLADGYVRNLLPDSDMAMMNLDAASLM